MYRHSLTKKPYLAINYRNYCIKKSIYRVKASHYWRDVLPRGGILKHCIMFSRRLDILRWPRQFLLDHVMAFRLLGKRFWTLLGLKSGWGYDVNVIFNRSDGLVFSLAAFFSATWNVWDASRWSICLAIQISIHQYPPEFSFVPARLDLFFRTGN